MTMMFIEEKEKKLISQIVEKLPSNVREPVRAKFVF
jgi:hypothetical protein